MSHNKPYLFNYLVLIGRFQGPHRGHMTVIDRALKISEKLIIVLGSHNEPRSFRNIWNSQERMEMIRSLYPNDLDRIEFVFQETYTYNNTKWTASIQAQVHNIVGREDAVIGLIGHAKDHSSYYLKMFPQWKSYNVDEKVRFDATMARVKLFETNQFDENIPPSVQQYIHKWWKENPDAVDYVKEEYAFLKEHDRLWEGSPYPPMFITVDAAVVQSGHILLIERDRMPGKGLWALPGGYLNRYEKIEDGVLRELREETRLKVPTPVLKGSIKEHRVFDDPYRSQRGRIVTHAFHFQLADDIKLPKVTGGDDARKAFWVELGSLKRNNMFEDHYDIIDELVNL